MKLVGIISTAALSLILGITVPAYAQQEQHDQQEDKHGQDAKPARQQEKHGQEAKPAQQAEKHAQPAKPAQQEEKHAQQQQREQKQGQPEQNKQQQRAGQQAKHEQPQRTPEQQHVQHSAWQEHRAKSWQSDHRTWQQRGGYIGYRIPDGRFRGYFGPEHFFRIQGLPFLVVGGYPRFQYSGYWFSPVDPWPEYWATNWYDTDDVYVVYVDNGYYMYNRRYPNVGIAINISL